MKQKCIYNVISTRLYMMFYIHSMIALNSNIMHYYIIIIINMTISGMYNKLQR